MSPKFVVMPGMNPRTPTSRNTTATTVAAVWAGVLVICAVIEPVERAFILASLCLPAGWISLVPIGSGHVRWIGTERALDRYGAECPAPRRPCPDMSTDLHPL